MMGEPHTMDRPLRIDRTVNINTVIAVLTFVIMIGGGLITVTTVTNKLQSNADAWVDFQKRQEAYNTNLDQDRRASRGIYDTKLDNLVAALTRLTAISDQFSYQIAQLQKKDEETDARLGRMSESYADKFTELQTTLSAQNTQIALIAQTVQEIKAALSSIPVRPSLSAN